MVSIASKSRLWAFISLLVSFLVFGSMGVAAQFTNPYQRTSTYGNTNLGFGDGFYTRYNNQYLGDYGVYSGPGNQYFRGQPFLTAAYSPGYTPRYGMDAFRTPATVTYTAGFTPRYGLARPSATTAYSPGFVPRYGVLQQGMNDGFAFSPGYTDERYALTPLALNDGFIFSPGYNPRYGNMRIAAGGPAAVYPTTYNVGPRGYYVNQVGYVA
ncbi:hypothetical protein HYS48_01665 [Candidatus Woesearchaeota archaeon]|nr:hypothetical protein [Candidatus Woesearchaeota archaeon]